MRSPVEPLEATPAVPYGMGRQALVDSPPELQLHSVGRQDGVATRSLGSLLPETFDLDRRGTAARGEEDS